MIFFGKIKEGELLFNDQRKLDKFIRLLKKDCEVEIKITKKKGLRTDQQNAALHLYFTQLSTALNEKGITAEQIFIGKIEHFWTPVIIKEMWRKIQIAMFKKRSTTELGKLEEIDKIYDAMNKAIVERTCGEVSVQFPSIETLQEENF